MVLSAPRPGFHFLETHLSYTHGYMLSLARGHTEGPHQVHEKGIN